jgi:hypothetical protein
VKERQVKTSNAEAGEVTILKGVEQFVGDDGEGELAGHVSVADAVKRGCGRRDWYVRFEALNHGGMSS